MGWSRTYWTKYFVVATQALLHNDSDILNEASREIQGYKHHLQTHLSSLSFPSVLHS